MHLIHKFIAFLRAWFTVSMPMLCNERGSVTVDQTWVYKFNNTIQLAYQQTQSLLEKMILPGMSHRNISAQIDHHERMAPVVANDVVSPFGQTQILNPVHSRRAVTMQSSDAAVLVSDENTLRAMVDPTNQYTTTIVAALSRRADKHIINAAIGTAQTAAVTAGTGVITYSTQAMLSSHILGTGVAISLTNIIAANELLSKGGCAPGNRVMLYSPGQLRDIMAITQASSSDFTRNRIHDKGTIDGEMWEGFLWVQIADVANTDAVTSMSAMLPLSSTTRSVIAFDKGSIGLSSGRDITTKINERPDLNNSIQVRSMMMMGAVRVWDRGVVEIDVLDN